MRAAGQRLSSLGNQLTTAISVPLGLIGVAAIKSAGDLESLTLAMRTTFETAGRSIADADAEVQALRKSALAPGLDFEQAVKASIRLQAVELSAEDARRTIEQLANSIAMTGGTAQNLESVTVQMSQMISKGKVLSQDLRIIQENMPIISKLMKQAFNTSNAEELQKLGITGKEFVAKITDEMAKLPRVSGGIANSMVNFFSSLKNSAATLGLAMNKAFDITGKLDAFAAFITSVADGFAGLNPAIQTVIISMGALFFAIGPLTSALGIMKSNWAAIIGVWGGMVSVAKSLQVWLLNVASAFRALSLATQAFVLVGVAIAIAAIVTQLGLFNHELTAAEKAQQSVNQLVMDSASAMQQEKTKVGELVKVVENQNAKYEDRKKAIEALKRISPEYFGQLSLEKTEYGGLKTAVEGYIKSMVDAETVRRAVARKAEIEIEKQNAALNTTTTIWQDVKAATLGVAGGGISAAKSVQYFAENLNATNQALDREDKLLDEVIAKHGGILVSTEKVTTKTKGLTEEQKKLNAELAQKRLRTYKEVLSDIANVSAQQDLLGSERVIEQAKAIEGGIRKLLDVGFKPASAQVQQLKKDLQGLFTGVKGPEVPQVGTLPTPTEVKSDTDPFKGVGESVQVATDKLTAFKTVGEQVNEVIKQMGAGTTDSMAAWKNLTDVVALSGGVFTAVAAQAAGAFAATAASGEASFESLGQAALKAAAEVVRAKLMESVVNVAADAFSKFGLLGFAAAAIGGGLVVGLFNKLVSSIKVPSFAGGTDFHKGGLAITSEKGPELLNLPRGTQITPNHKLNNLLQGGASNVNVGGTFRIVGSDLVVVLEKAQQQAKRIRGY